MQYLDFYVYVHRRKDTNQIFYVGKGRLKRAFLKTGRSKAWKSIASTYGYVVEIVRTGLSNSSALELEFDLIRKNKDLVNKICKRKHISMDINLLSEWVQYDSGAPSGLKWLKSKGKIKEGTTCGVLRENRYSFSLLNNRYICSRVVWLLHTKILNNEYVIDHIDGNSLNNKIENLREISYKANSNNTSKHRINLHTLGVTEYKTKDKNGNVTFHCYGSYYDDMGIEHRKSFSFLKYGKEEAIRLAIKFRKEGLSNVPISC